MKHEFHENDRVRLTLAANGVAQVVLTRADKLNALDPPMFDALIEVGQALFDMPSLRAVVLSGEGKGFCAGLDLASMQDLEVDTELSLSERAYGNANRFQQVAMQWRKLPVPVIAAVHGVCLGGGLQIAGGADIRVAAPDARLAVMEVKWGIVPDMGGFALWRGLVRDDALRELTYTHREFNGEQARELGFVTHVDPDPLALATAIAEAIAAQSPHAVRSAKALFARAADGTADEILLAESLEQHKLIGSRNQIEAVRSQMERRASEFVDP
jgi:enoyl-CoA hydratase/carnithine racemase